VRVLLIALAMAAGVYIVAVAALYLGGRRTAGREVATLLPNLLRLFKGLVRDPRVPRRSKMLLIFGASWVASPIDLIPEFIPVLGPLDDAVVGPSSSATSFGPPGEMSSPSTGVVTPRPLSDSFVCLSRGPRARTPERAEPPWETWGSSQASRTASSRFPAGSSWRSLSPSRRWRPRPSSASSSPARSRSSSAGLSRHRDGSRCGRSSRPPSPAREVAYESIPPPCGG
jgi:uncharacterized membrane protein YkvA (DUF1232 family)